MICPLLRGHIPFVCLLAALFLPSAVLRAQAPQGRITNTFKAHPASYEPILETETMIVSAETVAIEEWPGKTRYEWRKVKFWNRDGSNYNERIIPPGLGANTWTKCIAHGNDIFLPDGGSFHMVNRNPAVQIKRLNYN
ncbi:hypothetical protein [Luteolibacter luteus]|uniref:Uncharacterized protein n=1 Tax=Luteolibacter luteus TaxID=2728835 RepID=A0A858RJC3_9BACT|nr:hypothetical protein [Luteolibacter luteus]QJE96509.1 hypothetical protein HHL09_12200 [Luteolibacter luteus]